MILNRLMSWQVVIVTGASRGYGQAVCVSFAKAATVPTLLLISSRNKEGLNVTRDEIKNIKSGVQILVGVCVADLSIIDNIEENAGKLFDLSLLPNNAVVEKVTFVNNHGDVRPVGPVETSQLCVMSSVINTNVTGFCFLVADCIRRFKSGWFQSSCKDLTLVNVSSLCAVQPFATMALYSAGKAARDMYIKSVAEEVKTDLQLQESRLIIRLLNYAPGPMDTAMAQELLNTAQLLPGLRDFYENGQKNKTLVDVHDSAEKLLHILAVDKFENGQHIDFYDIIA